MSTAPESAALLELVEAYRRDGCEKALAQARAEARQILREAHRGARQKLRDVIGAERERAADEVKAARAQLQTRTRLFRQKQRAELIAQGWPQLRAELARRWRNRETQGLWVEALMERAKALLPRGPWRIVHAPGWPEHEKLRLAQVIEAHSGTRPDFTADEAMAGGLRIIAGDNVLDATLEGLLEDRAQVAARLLELWEEQS